jgi:SPOR domain
MGGNTKTIITLCLGMILLGGCASSKKSERDEADAEFAESVRELEKDFQPSDYEPAVEPFFRQDQRPRNEISDTVAVFAEAKPDEQTQGFRVQIYSSSSIDSAKAMKVMGERDFPDELFYLVYDPPKYKVRAGNFLSRFEADRFVRQLTERGYSDGWVVPDRILKNPPKH